MLSEDVLREVLYRLPLQDLDTCAYICDEYRDLISDPDFDRDKRRVMGDNAILSTYIHDITRFDVLGLRSDGHIEPLVSQAESHWYNVNIDRYADDPVVVLGSYNGLIAIKYNYFDYVLWNPATFEYKEYDGNQGLLISHYAVGFCHSACRDEYMALIIGTTRLNHVNVPVIELINFTTNESTSVSWNLEDDVEGGWLMMNKVGIVVCGVPHWIGSVFDPTERKRVILFDPNSLRFNELELPNEEALRGKQVLGLGALNGQTQLGIVLQDIKKPHQSYDIWVMKEYGNPESWTFQCKIPSLNIRECYEHLNLLGLKPGEIWIHHVTLDSNHGEAKLITYDLDSKRSKKVQVTNGEGANVNVISYEPSLLSLQNLY